MVLSEAQALWGKEKGKLEQLTGKKIVTLQDGIDAIKSRAEEIKKQERLADSDIDVLGILNYYADAIVTIKIADTKHQAYLRDQREQGITSINITLDLLNK